jgi:hypothetical protein
VEKAEVGVFGPFPERRDDQRGTPGIDVQSGDQSAELRRSEMIANLKYHLGFGEEFEGCVHRPFHQATLTVFMDIKTPVHEGSQFTPGPRESGSDQRQHVRVEGIGFGNL